MNRQCNICGKENSTFRWESVCCSCRQKKWDDDIKDEIISGERDGTDCEDKIYCPHCGEVYDICPADDSDLFYECDTERECIYCGKEFSINVSVSYSYSASRKDKDA